MVAVAGLALVAGLAMLTAQAVARPIEELAARARSLPAGDVGRVGGGPELDHLVDALNRMLERTSEIRIDEAVHGPRGARRYSSAPTFILRGLMHLNLEFDPVEAGSR